MARKGIGSKRSAEVHSVPRPEGSSLLARRKTDVPSSLHRVEDSPLSALSPGDILLLSGAELSYDLDEVIFHAVLACPSCGTLIPVTPSQYLGALPLMCGSNLCCCRFRIADKSRLIYLPVV